MSNPCFKPCAALQRWLKGALRDQARKVLPVLAAGLFAAPGAGHLSAGEIRSFPLLSQTIMAEEITSEASVFFRAMRFNEATEQWNVDLVVTNQGERSFTQALFLTVESFSNTTGPLAFDGISTNPPVQSFIRIDLGSFLAPGKASLPRTIALGVVDGAGAPRMQMRVFGVPFGLSHALALTRSLNGAGQPLAGVRVTERGPREDRLLFTDPNYGIVTLGQSPGEHTWKFELDGHLPVWRQQTLLRGAVRLLPHPRLARRNTNSTAIAASGNGIVMDPNGNVRLEFRQPGQSAVVTLTLVDGQTLPGLLPQGWSPLRAFWVESTNAPIVAIIALKPEGSIAPTDTAALVKWNVDTTQWQVQGLPTGDGTNVVVETLDNWGAYALVVADSGLLAPPAPVAGQPLFPSTTPPQPASSFTAAGTVTPSTGLASRVAEQVTAIASVGITNSTGLLPSGLTLRTEVTEDYRLQDSSMRFIAHYETFVTAYRGPADSAMRALSATFPMRPQLLFGGDELAGATVRVDVLAPDIFRGGVFDLFGGSLTNNRVRIYGAPGDFVTPQAALLRLLASTNLSTLLIPGQSIAAAFDLTVASVEPGRSLSLQVSNLAPNRFFILSRILSGTSFNGLEPVERLRSGTNGVLTSLEPASGERLPGLCGAGQYLLVQVSGPHALIGGLTRNAQDQPTPGVPVRVVGQPWLTFSTIEGIYLLVAPTGAVQVAATDLASGDTDFVNETVEDPNIPVAIDLGIRVRGPRVSSVTPPANARNVSLVTPIVVTFSKSLNPATVSNGGIQLFGSNGLRVSASLTLNQRGTTATILPVDPLAAGTQHTLRLGSGLTDVSGLSLEGPASYTFTTATDHLNRPAAAQVISHEPLNGIARMEGTQGIADPETPVILVNDTTGQTGTTLSKIDGSFTGEINASVEDRLRAVFVNQNGTRTEMPVGRQLFPDGSVALFSGGGSLTNANDELSIAIEVPPGATAGRTKFKIEPLKATDLASVSSNTPPLDATVFGLFNLKVEGDALLVPVKFTFQPDLSRLVPPPGQTIDDITLLAAAPRVIEELGPDGLTNIVVYQVFGRLAQVVTTNEIRAASALGLLYSVLLDPVNASVALFGTVSYSKIAVSGRVQSALFTGGNQLTEGTEIPLAGAVVRARSGSGINRAFTLQPGEAITVSGAGGEFAFQVPAQAVGGPVLIASHPNFPRQFAASAGSRFDPNHPLGGGVITFDRSRPPDTTPPSLVVTHAPTLPQVQDRVAVLVQAIDDSGPPVPQLVIQEVDPPTAVALLTLDRPGVWALQCNAPAKVTLKARARDGFGNTRELVYAILFGQRPAPPPTGNDPFGPNVTFSQPDVDAVQVSTYAPITLRFNKPVDPDIVANPTTYLTLSPGAGRPRAEFGRDQREVLVRFPALLNGTNYTLTLQALSDLRGQVFDQNPHTNSPPAEPFVLRFHTAPEIRQDLPGIDDGKGVVMHGAYAYVIDRSQSALSQFDLSIPSQPVRVAQKFLPGPPWSLALIPDYSHTRTYVRGNTDPTPPLNPPRSDFLAVAGKVSGQSSSYLRIFDLRQPLETTASIAGGVLSLDDTALITRLVWSPPYLLAVENNLSSPAIHVLNFQSLLLSDAFSRLPRQQVMELGLSFTNTPGLDANGDGDFVDLGDKLPLLGIESLDFTAGEVDLLSLSPNRDDFGPQFGFFRNLVSSSRFITAVVADGTSEFIGALIAPGQDTIVEQLIGNAASTNRLARPASLRSFIVGQLSPDTALPPVSTLSRYVIEFPGWYPKQTLLVNDGLRKLALVSLISLTGPTNSLRVIDVTRPDFLTEVNEISVPVTEFGLLGGGTIDDQGTIVLSTARADGEHFILLDPTKLLLPAPAVGSHPAIIGFASGSGSGGAGGLSSFVSQRHGTAAASQRNQNSVTQTSPFLRLVNAGTNWFDPFGQTSLAPRLAEIRALPDMLELPVARHSTNSNLIPPDPRFHWQLLFAVPGGAGRDISLAVMSVGGQGAVIPRVNTVPPPAVLPAVPLRRLSDDLHSPAFNVYLSRPLVLVGENIGQNELVRANSALDRHILFAGQRIRVGISEDFRNNPVLGPFAGTGVVSATPTVNALPVKLGSSLALPVLANVTPELTAQDPVIVKTHVDGVNNTSCPGSAWLDFEHNINCNISILIDGQPLQNVQDENGNRYNAFTDVTLGAGRHRVLIDSAHVPQPGEHTFEITATELDGQPPGTTVMVSGTIQHEVEINHTFPIGHTIIQGVDIWDGHLTHSRQDVLVPGRRLSLDFSRSYSSQGNSSDGLMGAGWTHSYNIRVVEQCGVFTVIGGEGSGNAFRNPQVNTVLAARYSQFLSAPITRYEFFRPQIGYHSTLVRDTGRASELWFFTKSAVRYHFISEPKLSTPNARVFTVREIREPNGNVIRLDYLNGDLDPATLDTVVERHAGIEKRGFRFEYTNIVGAPRIIALRGFNQQAGGDLLGLEILYRYDQWANLTNVSRMGTRPNDTRSEYYTYTPRLGPLGHNLLTYTDPNGAVTRYDYGASGGLGYYQVGIPLNDVPAHEVVRSVTRVGAARPGFAGTSNSVTRFRYEWPTFQRFVSDPRPTDSDGSPIPETQYGLNVYGATTNIVAPLGQTTIMRWATDHRDGSVRDEAGQPVNDVLMTYKMDGEAQEHFYEYHDGRGNLTREVARVSASKEPIYDASGNRVLESISISGFEDRFNARTNHVDAEGNTTVTRIDPANGNLRFIIDAEGNTTELTYKPNGDLDRRIDPRGFVTEFPRYDLYGNAEIVRAQVGALGDHIATTNVFDERSRLLDTRDTFGHHSRSTYDGLDRRVREERLNDLSGLLTGPGAVALTSYLPGGEVTTMTNALGLVTTFDYDALNRKVRSRQLDVRQATGGPVTYTNLLAYDAAGNIVSETDGRGVARTHIHDALNRRVRTEMSGPFGGPFKPDRILSSVTYDRVNNVQAETDLHGFVTTHLQDGLYRIVETRLPFPNAIVRTRFDRLGTKRWTTDANGNAAEFSYDRIYRLIYSKDAEGNESDFHYDRSGNRTNIINRSSGLSMLTTFDGLNRAVEGKQTGPGLPVAGYISTTTFNDSRNEVIAQNPRGFKIRSRKDGLDRTAESVVDDGGLNLTSGFTYDAGGNVLTVVDPQNGDVDVTHTYDQLSRKLRSDYVTTPGDGGVPVFERVVYDSNGNTLHTRDRRGIERRMAYDNLNRPLTSELKEDISNGGAWLLSSEVSYDDQANKVTAFDARRNRTVSEKDELGRVKKIIDALGQFATSTYDGLNKLSSTDKKGQRAVFTYDRLNRLKSTTEFDTSNVAQTSTAIEYLDRSRQQIVTDRRGLRTRATADALGRTILSERLGGDLSTRYGADPLPLARQEYDGNNNSVKVTDADGRVVMHEYDGADRKIATTEGFGSGVAGRTTFTYDNVGNLLESKDPRSHTTTFDVKSTYDERYRRVSAANALGETTRFAYDPANNLTNTTEPLGFQSRYVYDEVNALLAVDETPRAIGGDAGVTRFRYDVNRNKTAQQDANGNLVTYAYDALNRLTNTFQHTVAGTIGAVVNRAASPGGGSPLIWGLGYDANNNQSRILDARGQLVDLTYDHLNRLVLRTYSRHAETNANGSLIDFQPISMAYSYDGNGNPTNIVEVKQLGGAPVTERTTAMYDTLDRLMVKTRFDHDDAVGRALKFNYDRAGNRSRIEDPDGRLTDYAFDERNRLTNVTLNPGALAANYAWTADSLLQRIDYPGASFALRAYDPADRVVSITNAHSSGTIFSTYGYTYDANGNRTQQTELQPALNVPADATAYFYDRLNRLTNVVYGGGAGLRYTYSPNGNRLTETGTDPVTGAPVDRVLHYTRQAARAATTFNGVNTLTRIEDRTAAGAHIDYDYDPNLNQVGRTQGGSANRFRFDIRDQIILADAGGSVVRFDYNADRLRVKKLQAGAAAPPETRYLYDQSSVLIEYGPTGTGHATQQKYDYGNELLALGIADAFGALERRFYLTDALRSTANLVTTAGTAANSYRYDSWGRLRAKTGSDENRRQFTGHYRDQETGLHYFGARYYDEEQARFLSQDPYLGEANEPPSLHRYLYVYANPLRFIDLNGYQTEEVGLLEEVGVRAAAEVASMPRRLLGMFFGQADITPHERAAIDYSSRRGDLWRAVGVGGGVQETIDNWNVRRELGSSGLEAAALWLGDKIGVNALGQAITGEGHAKADFVTGERIDHRDLSTLERVVMGVEGSIKAVSTVMMAYGGVGVKGPGVAEARSALSQGAGGMAKLPPPRGGAFVGSPAGMEARSALSGRAGISEVAAGEVTTVVEGTATGGTRIAKTVSAEVVPTQHSVAPGMRVDPSRAKTVVTDTAQAITQVEHLGVTRARATAANMTGSLESRSVEVLKEPKVFTHSLFSSSMPESATANIIKEGSMRISTVPVRSQYGSGLYAYAEGAGPQKLPLINIEVQAGTAVETLTVRGQGSFYRIVPASGNRVPVKVVDWKNLDSDMVKFFFNLK